MDNKDLIKMRDSLRESADIIDEVLALEERENNGEDVRKELESAVGRFTIKMLELNSL
ncbi:hypothetical protein ACR77J_17265 [Tissierella praeacuta]|uniref:hypothetical protein n=1 Tax=Tissierella praeacuta TaxID=43131 RepID=UPI003DA45DAD